MTLYSHFLLFLYILSTFLTYFSFLEVLRVWGCVWVCGCVSEPSFIKHLPHSLTVWDKHHTVMSTSPQLSLVHVAGSWCQHSASADSWVFVCWSLAHLRDCRTSHLSACPELLLAFSGPMFWHSSLQVGHHPRLRGRVRWISGSERPGWYTELAIGWS